MSLSATSFDRSSTNGLFAASNASSNVIFRSPARADKAACKVSTSPISFRR
jgi:hypothetical protein